MLRRRDGPAAADITSVRSMETARESVSPDMTLLCLCAMLGNTFQPDFSQSLNQMLGCKIQVNLTISTFGLCSQ